VFKILSVTLQLHLRYFATGIIYFFYFFSKLFCLFLLFASPCSRLQEMKKKNSELAINDAHYFSKYKWLWKHTRLTSSL